MRLAATRRRHSVINQSINQSIKRSINQSINAGRLTLRRTTRAADIMEATVAEILFDAYSSDGMQPISPWLDLDDVPLNAQRLSHDTFVAEVQTPQLVARYSRPTDSVSSRIRRSSASSRRCVPTPGEHLPPFQKPRLWDHHGQSDGCNPGQIRQPCPQRLLAHHHAQRGSLRPSPSQIHMGVQGETRRHAPKADSAFRGCSLVKQVWTTTRRLLRQCARRPHGVFLLTQHAAGVACAAWIGSPPTFRVTSSMGRRLKSNVP